MKELVVKTGCRLHFGLMELCRTEPNCYAGLGLMLESPSLTIRFCGGSSLVEKPHEVALDVPEELTERVQKTLDWRFQNAGEGSPLPTSIRFESSLPLHRGLGAGTQTACAFAAGLEIFSKQKSPCGTTRAASSESITLEILQRLSQRGLRSAIGLQGFLSGGLILDHGYDANDPDADHRSITARATAVNEDWCVFLLTPNMDDCIAGETEASMIESIGHKPNPNQHSMEQLAKKAFAAAEFGRDLREFASFLDEYMELAGRLFAAMQGGQYVSASVASTVQTARDAGLVAVGQSSWGPTVFGFCNRVDCEQIQSRLKELLRDSDCDIRLTKPANAGAGFQWEE